MGLFPPNQKEAARAIIQATLVATLIVVAVLVVIGIIGMTNDDIDIELLVVGLALGVATYALIISGFASAYQLYYMSDKNSDSRASSSVDENVRNLRGQRPATPYHTAVLSKMPI